MCNEEDKLMQLVDEMGQGRLTSPENALHVERTEFITSFIGSMAQATSEPLGFGAKNAEAIPISRTMCPIGGRIQILSMKRSSILSSIIPPTSRMKSISGFLGF